MSNKINYVVEPALLLSIIISYGFLIGSPGFGEFDIHPYYLVILAFTIRYGYLKGIVSMLLSCAAFVAIFTFDNSYIALLEFRDGYDQIIAFTAFWMFIGLLVDVDKRKIKNLTTENIKHQAALLDNESKIEKLVEVNKKISDELISSDQSFNILFERTKNLFNEDIMSIYGAAFDILTRTIQATEAYILYIENDKFEIAFPADADMDYIDIHKELIERVKATQNFVRLDRQDSSLISKQSPVYVGPIIHESSGTLFGIIIVQEIDFLKYNENTFRTFVNLCHWMGEIFYFRTKQELEVAPINTNCEFDYQIERGTISFNTSTHNEQSSASLPMYKSSHSWQSNHKNTTL